MASRLIAYPQGLAAALAAPPMVEAMHNRMRPAMLLAERLSPVRTGRYKGVTTAAERPGNPGAGGFVLVSGVRGGVAYARLLNITPYAVYLEFGTRYMRRQRILGRAMSALR